MSRTNADIKQEKAGENKHCVVEIIKTRNGRFLTLQLMIIVGENRKS